MGSWLDFQWLGVAAVIWLIVGGGIEVAIEHIVPDLIREYVSLTWIFCGWLGPSFILAVAGLRRGNLASRICSILVLIAFALPLLLIAWAAVTLRGH